MQNGIFVWNHISFMVLIYLHLILEHRIYTTGMLFISHICDTKKIKNKIKYWVNQAIGIHVQDSSKAKMYSVLVMHCSVSLKAWWPGRYVDCSLSLSVLACTLTMQVQVVFISHDSKACLYQKVPVGGGGVVLWRWYSCKQNRSKMEEGYLFQVCR